MKRRIFTLLLVVCSGLALAQNRYWISTTSSNWNNSANWSTTSGGAGGASVPGATNLAIFNGSGGRNGACALDIAPTVGGITINGYSGSIDLNSNSLQTTGTNVFTSGSILNTGSAATLTINSTTASTFSGTVFSVPITGASADLNFNGSVFNNTVTLTKTGSNNNNNTGGNTWNAAVIITNNGNGELNFAVTNPDQFNSTATLNNNGTARLQVGVNSSGNVFAAGLTINHGGTSSGINTILSRNAGSSVTVNGNLVLNQSNGSTSSGIIIANDGQVTINGNILVSSTNGRGILFGGNSNSSGSVTLSAGFVVSNVAGSYTTGLLSFYRFNQVGGTPQTLLLTGDADLVVGQNCEFDGDVNFVSPQLHLDGGTYNGTATLEKSGATNSSSSGGNTFNGTTTITNSSAAEIFMGNGTADTFNAPATFNNTGSYRIRIAYNHPAQTTVFASDVVLNSAKTGGTDQWSFLVAEATDTHVSFGASLTINCSGSLESDHRFLQGTGSVGTFAGPVIINLTNSNSSTSINMGVNGTASYSGNITMTNTADADGVYFNSGSGSSTLLAGTIGIGGAGFSGGTISLIRFTQSGAVPQTISIPSGQTRLVLGPSSSFDGTVNFSVPQLYLNGTTFNAGTTLEKNGAVNNYANGGNAFNGATTIINSGSGYLLSGGTNADTFNNATIINNIGTHRIYLAHNHTGQTTTFASDVTFSSNKTGGTETYALQVGEGANSNVSFQGNVTINCDGLYQSDHRIAGGSGSTATYAGVVSINLTNSHPSTMINMGGNGTSTYKGNIIVSNTGGASGISFNNGTGSATLESPGSISVAPAGFTSGTLNLPNFTQTGATPQTLNSLSGTARLIVGPNSSFDGTVDFKSPQLNLNGATFNSAAQFEKSGATDNNSAGGNVFNGATIITNSGSGYLLLGNNNADTFNGTATFNNTGSYRIFLAHNHGGQTTTFASDVIFNANKSGGTDAWSYFINEGTNTGISFGANVTFNLSGMLQSNIRILNGSSSTWSVAGTTTINITNTHAATQFFFGVNGTSTFNDNMIVSNSGGASGIYFNANSAASSTLAATRTITIGPAGFTDGTLSLIRFTQLGNTPQVLNTFTGNGRLIVGPSSAFGGNVDFKAPQVYLNGCVYTGTADIEKTGAVDNYGTGGNTFGGDVTLTTSGSGYFLIGGNNADTFNGLATFNNNGTYRLYFAYNHPGQTTTFAQDVYLNSNRTGGSDQWAYLVAEAAGSNILFGGKLIINCMGTVRSDYRFLNGSSTSQTYSDNVEINVTNTHPSTTIYMGATGTSTYNGDITVSNSGGANGIYFNTNSPATSTLASGRTISVGPLGFNGGTLSLIRFTQLGNTPQVLTTFTGSSRLIVGPSSVFNGTVNFKSPQIYLNGAAYNRTAILEKTGAVDNYSDGGNRFSDVTEITNTGSGEIFMGNVNSDEFDALTTFNNTGSYRIRIAHNHTNQTTTFAGNVTLNSNKSGGSDQWSFLVCDGTNTHVSFAGNLAINIAGSLRSDHRFLNGTGSTASFGGSVMINSSNSNTIVTMGVNGTSTYLGNISVANTNGANGIYFNTGAAAASTLASGMSIAIGAAGFDVGTLSLPRFTQLGPAPQTLNTFTGTATLNVGPSSTFNGPVTFVAPQINLNGATYNQAAYVEKTGAANNNSVGGNTFNGTTQIVNSSTGRLRLAATDGDAFNGQVTFTKSSTGVLEPAYTALNTFSGNLITDANTAVTFGASSGVVQFTGVAAQTVSKTASTSSPIFQRMTMAKTGSTLTLNNNVTIGAAATFTSGIINTTATNFLNFADNAVVISANDLSYVDGPVRKTGNDAFVFPVGAGNYYRPISIGAPSSTAHHFTAQYFLSAQTFGGVSTYDPSFYDLSSCDYWILDRTNGASNVTVTLSWNENACSGPGYITNPADLRVARWTGTAWTTQGNGGTTGNTANGTIVSSAAVTSFSPFALASVSGDNPLPIDLVRFWATDADHTVTLRWVTATERNNKFFQLERSLNGFDFVLVGKVNGAGTTTMTNSYSYTDDGPYPGLSYYRLTQIDYDGNKESWICSVTHKGVPEAFVIYPNPAGNEIVHLNQKSTVVILNSLDQIVRQYEEAILIDVSDLDAGVYILRNQNGQVARLVKK